MKVKTVLSAAVLLSSVFLQAQSIEVNITNLSHGLNNTLFLNAYDAGTEKTVRWRELSLDLLT